MTTVPAKRTAYPNAEIKNAWPIAPSSTASYLLVNREYSFEPGKLTPTPAKRWLELLKKSLNLFDKAELESRLREELDYHLQDIVPDEAINDVARRYVYVREHLQAAEKRILSGNEEVDMQAELWLRGRLKVELAICLIDLSYGDELRKSGHLAVTHNLRAGLFAAALGAPIEWVVSALLHDIREDTRDKKNIKYRTACIADGEIRIETLHSAKDIFNDLRHCFGREVEKDIRVLTRDPVKKKKAGETLTEIRDNYSKYLVRANRRISAAFIKVIDGILNFWELDPVKGSKQAKQGLIDRTVIKGSLQVEFWRKISWLLSEMLMQEIVKYSPQTDTVTDRFERRISEEELERFERACIIIRGKREFKKKILNQSSDNGSPVMVLYKIGRNLWDAELPYIKDKMQIARIFEGLVKPSEMEDQKTILLPKIRKAKFRRFRAKLKDVAGMCGGLALRYDKELKLQGIVLTELRERKNIAAEVRAGRYYEPTLMAELAGTRSRENGVSLRLPELPEGEASAAIRRHHLGIDTVSPHLQGRFRLKPIS